jgi:hypothetical protein
MHGQVLLSMAWHSGRQILYVSSFVVPSSSLRRPFVVSSDYTDHSSSHQLCSWKELRAQVGVGLSSGLSGFPYWSSDVAGFSGVPSPELAARWHQFGSVCSLYRSHGSRTWNEPWSYGPEAEASITKSIKLRSALKPYIMELAANASAYGTVSPGLFGLITLLDLVLRAIADVKHTCVCYSRYVSNMPTFNTSR